MLAAATLVGVLAAAHAAGLPNDVPCVAPPVRRRRRARVALVAARSELTPALAQVIPALSKPSLQLVQMQGERYAIADIALGCGRPAAPNPP